MIGGDFPSVLDAARAGAEWAVAALYRDLQPALLRYLRTKERTYALAREFLARFEARYGATACSDLLGVDISTVEGHSAARASDLFKTTCPVLVAGAAAILAEMGV